MEVERIAAKKLSKLGLSLKIGILAAGGVLFFFLFPFFTARKPALLVYFCVLIAIAGAVFRAVSGKKIFRAVIWLWLTGSFIYMLIALFLIIKNIQPLPYMVMSRPSMVLYYVSYPLRVLGILFTGLIFIEITSPVEFLRWGKAGLKVALAFRAFEYAAFAFADTRDSLVIQGLWPDGARGMRGFRAFALMLRNAPVLIATTLRNIILWSPWAWISFNKMMNEIMKRRAV